MMKSHQVVLSEKAHTASMFRSVIRLLKAQEVCQTRKMIYEYEVSILNYFKSLCSFSISFAWASLCHHWRQQRFDASYCVLKVLFIILLIISITLFILFLSLNLEISCSFSCTKTLLISLLHNWLNIDSKVEYFSSFLSQICVVDTSIIFSLFS